jgi:hypothetical protein
VKTTGAAIDQFDLRRPRLALQVLDGVHAHALVAHQHVPDPEHQPSRHRRLLVSGAVQPDVR